MLTVRQADVSAPLIKFDLSGVDSRYRVRDAKLRLYASRRSNSSGLTVSAFNVLRPWTASYATWENSSNPTKWAVAGCNGEGTDREGTAQASLTLNMAENWFSFDITEMVRGWVADPASNQGLVLKGARVHVGAIRLCFLRRKRQVTTTPIGPRARAPRGCYAQHYADTIEDEYTLGDPDCQRHTYTQRDHFAHRNGEPESDVDAHVDRDADTDSDVDAYSDDRHLF